MARDTGEQGWHGAMNKAMIGMLAWQNGKEPIHEATIPR